MIIESALLVTALVEMFGSEVTSSLVRQLRKPHFSKTLIGLVEKDMAGSISRPELSKLRGLVTRPEIWSLLVDTSDVSLSNLELRIAQEVTAESSPTERARSIAQSLVSNLLQSLDQQQSIAILDFRRRRDSKSSKEDLQAEIRSAGPLYGYLGRSDYLAKVVRECNARRWGRRKALGLSPDQIAAAFSVLPDLPDEMASLEAGKLLILRAPIGSGKSDLCERWLLGAADKARMDEKSGVPLWLRAQEVASSLENEVLTTIGPHALNTCGITLVLDGLDESGERGSLLLEQAETFVSAWPRSRVVVSTREGSTTPRTNAVQVPAWAEDDALALVSAVRGEKVSDYQWHPALRDAIKRPLFALIAGSHLADVTYESPAGLIEVCVERALEGTSYVPQLQELAVSLTTSGEPVNVRVLGASARTSLKDSRLLAFSGNHVQFSLPIFEQWFAAQAVLDGQVHLEQYAGSMANFSRWRYVLSVAMAAGPQQNSLPIITSLAKWNPGAASWTLREARSTSLRGSAQVFSSWEEPARAIRGSTEAWVEGLGPAAALVRPTGTGRSHVRPLTELTLGVTLHGNQLAESWFVSGPGDPQVVSKSVHPFDNSITGALTARLGSPTNHALWAMEWVQEGMVQDLGGMLESAAYLFAPPGGVVDLEYQWWVLTMIAKECKLKPSEVGLSLLEPMLEQIASGHDINNSMFQFRYSKSMETSALRSLVTRAQNGEYLASPWPERDHEHPVGGWVWGYYSPQRILDRARATFQGAIHAYDEIQRALFPTFGDSLGHRALFPAKLIGSLHCPEGLGWEHQPQVFYHFEPSGRPSQGIRAGSSSVEIELTDKRETWSAEVREAHLRVYSDYVRDNPDASAFASLSWTSSLLDIYGLRPATQQALRWLADDLSAIGWFSGPSRFDLR